MVDNGTDEANPHILVPAPALKEITITYKKEDKQDEVTVPSRLAGDLLIEHCITSVSNRRLQDIWMKNVLLA